MISVKALRALVASEWSVVLWVGLLMPIHVVHLSSVAAVEVWNHASGHATHRMA